jgi:hypothetical protein
VRPLILRIFANAPLAEFTRDQLNAISAAEWTIFLRAESCAMPVRQLLRQKQVEALLPYAAREALASAEATELRRVLAARESLRQLESISERLQLNPIVFKGGAVVAERSRQPLDLGDIDVLVPSSSVPALWEALVAKGWRPVTPVPPSTSDLLERENLPALQPPGIGLRIEIHRLIPYAMDAAPLEVEQSRPLEGYTRIRRFIGRAYVLALLQHSVVHHPHRRGHIRDLLMLAEELAGLSSQDRAEIRRALIDDAFELELADMLAQANALAEGELVTDSNRVRPFVAWKYDFAFRARKTNRRLARDLSTLSYIALERPPIRRLELRTQLREAFRRDEFDARIRKRRYGKAVPRSIVLGARVIYRCVLILTLAVSRSSVRRRVGKLTEFL